MRKRKAEGARGGGGRAQDGGGARGAQDADAGECDIAKVCRHPLYPRLVAAHFECHIAGERESRLRQLEEECAKCLAIGASPASRMQWGEDKNLDDFLIDYVVMLESLSNDLHFHCNQTYAPQADAADPPQADAADPPRSPPAAASPNKAARLAGAGGVPASPSLAGTGGVANKRAPAETPEKQNAASAKFEYETWTKEELRAHLKARFHVDIRNHAAEFRRRQPKGKLPEAATATLKAWWDEHTTWPYPTEEEKAAFVAQTRLTKGQVDNWFVNQRKRHWYKMWPAGVLPTDEHEAHMLYKSLASKKDPAVTAAQTYQVTAVNQASEVFPLDPLGPHEAAETGAVALASLVGRVDLAPAEAPAK